MAEQKIPQPGANPLLQGLQSEVAAENAPLLEFITRYAWLIASVVLALLLVLGGMAVWNWHKNSQLREAQGELARINLRLSGEAKTRALEELAQKAPQSLRLSIYLALAEEAQEAGNFALAGKAYGEAARLDGEGSLGLMAALGEAGALMGAEKYADALALLQKLETRVPPASPYLRQMLADAALRAKNPALAAETLRKLADETGSAQGAYYRKLVESLDARAASANPSKPASE